MIERARIQARIQKSFKYKLARNFRFSCKLYCYLPQLYHMIYQRTRGLQPNLYNFPDFRVSDKRVLLVDVLSIPNHCIRILIAPRQVLINLNFVMSRNHAMFYNCRFVIAADFTITAKQRFISS